jgi:hypothetical protein
MSVTLHHGDCLAVLKTMPDASVDSIVTDPPYGLSFMGKRWDYDVPSVEIWAECLRVLKPGGHLLAFAGTRTQHRMAVRIEDAGFEIRDMIAWVYGSGFPKSLDVSKAIDKIGGIDTAAFKAELAAAVAASGLTRAAIDAACGFTMRFDTPYDKDPGNWGSSLPSPEKWGVIARVLNLDESRWATLVKRVWRGRAGAANDGDTRRAFGQHYKRTDKGEVVTNAARQWAGWGTALKPALEPITVARKPLIGTVAENVLAHGTGALNVDGCRVEGAPPQATGQGWDGATGYGRGDNAKARQFTAAQGRWPANLIHDGSKEVGELLGSPARFFYCAKASKRDRGDGNNHPTVKPTDLMRYLCRLVTPPNGIVLDPFMGSGSTGKAAKLEKFNFIGIELDDDYLKIATARIEAAQ